MNVNGAATPPPPPPAEGAGGADRIEGLIGAMQRLTISQETIVTRLTAGEWNLQQINNQDAQVTVRMAIQDRAPTREGSERLGIEIYNNSHAAMDGSGLLQGDRLTMFPGLTAALSDIDESDEALTQSSQIDQMLYNTATIVNITDEQLDIIGRTDEGEVVSARFLHTNQPGAAQGLKPIDSSLIPPELKTVDQLTGEIKDNLSARTPEQKAARDGAVSDLVTLFQADTQRLHQFGSFEHKELQGSWQLYAASGNDLSDDIRLTFTEVDGSFTVSREVNGVPLGCVNARTSHKYMVPESSEQPGPIAHTTDNATFQSAMNLFFSPLADDSRDSYSTDVIAISNGVAVLTDSNFNNSFILSRIGEQAEASGSQEPPSDGDKGGKRGKQKPKFQRS